MILCGSDPLARDDAALAADERVRRGRAPLLLSCTVVVRLCAGGRWDRVEARGPLALVGGRGGMLCGDAPMAPSAVANRGSCPG